MARHNRRPDPLDRAQHPAFDPEESNERFRMLFERASSGIITVATAGHVVEANPAIERMLGYGPGELVGVRFETFTHPDDIDGTERRYQEFVDSGAPRTSTRSDASARTEK